jgi:hypothetical protein
VIAGFVEDDNFVNHGFVRAANGSFTTFDVRGACACANLGTFPQSINLGGTITGSYVDANGLSHGFVRSANGAITTFDVPDAPGATFPTSINLQGAITGYYQDANTAFHGFLRAPDGHFTTFDAPGAGQSNFEGTLAISNNQLAGEITGYFQDSTVNEVYHGFLRAPNGGIRTFGAPGAGSGLGQGTYAESISLLGEITGFYIDASNVTHGYIYLPRP